MPSYVGRAPAATGRPPPKSSLDLGRFVPASLQGLLGDGVADMGVALGIVGDPLPARQRVVRAGIRPQLRPGTQTVQGPYPCYDDALARWKRITHDTKGNAHIRYAIAQETLKRSRHEPAQI